MKKEKLSTPKLKAYFLEDPLLWVANTEFIKNIVLTAFKINSNNVFAEVVNEGISFRIDPLCGHISCSLYHDLWLNKQKSNVFNLSNVKKDEQKAIFSAKQFLKRLHNECSKEQFENTKIPKILPNYDWLVMQDCYLVPHHTENCIDHWLCRFFVYIPTDLTNTKKQNIKALVSGSNVEIRVGNNFKIVGFESFWRPTNLEYLEIDTLKLDEEHVKRTEHHHANKKKNNTKENELPIIYLLEGSQNPQNIIAPYYLKQDGHASFFFPASLLSLEIDFYQEHIDGKSINVHALISGGSGKFSFHWSYYKIDEDEWSPRSIKTIEKGENVKMISLSEGVYNLILLIGDNETGVVKQKQVSINTSLVWDKVDLNKSIEKQEEISLINT